MRMARCKCGYDKNPLDTKTAFKVVIDEKNTYWCSEECYNHFLEAKEKQNKINAEYDEIYELTKQIFGYEFTGYSLLKREINTWEKVGTRAKIIAYLTENKDWLSTVMSKEFASDFNRVRYYSVIVAGKLHDFKPKAAEVEKPKIVVEETIYDAPTQSTNKRRSLADLEDMF
jgi:YHS domain-containing protein